VAKGFVVSGVVSETDVASTSDGRFTTTLTLTVEKANKVARQAGWSVADTETVALDDVRLFRGGARRRDARGGREREARREGRRAPQEQQVRLRRKVGAPTFKKIVFKAPALEAEPQAGSS